MRAARGCVSARWGGWKGGVPGGPQMRGWETGGSTSFSRKHRGPSAWLQAPDNV